jgi:hypothetical protein
MIRYLALIPLLACSEFAFDSGASEDDMDSGQESTLGDAASPQGIRLDVYAESATDLGLLNQSFFVSALETDGMELSLEPSIEITGTLRGFQTFPTADVQIPGNDGPVAGQLRMFVPNSLMSYAVSTDDDGFFAFEAVPSENYTLAWIPDAGVNLPFEVEEGIPILEDSGFEKVLSYENSRSIFGRIQDDSGLGIPNLSVQVIDPGSGIGNSASLSNNMGAFHTRLYPGEYTLSVQSPAGHSLPTIETTLSVTDDPTTDLDTAIAFGNLDTINADGRVLNADGSAAGNVLVRFTAIVIDKLQNLQFKTESTTGSNGRYSIPVLPGSYQVELIPNHDDDSSPVLIERIQLNSDVTELDTVTLPSRTMVEGRLLDAFGLPAEGALIRAQEKGFDGAVFEAFTGDLGVFSIAVSGGPLSWTFSPKSPNQGAITFSDIQADSLNGSEFQLREGQLVSGCIDHRDGDVVFAPIEVRNEDDLLYASTFTDQEGCFAIRVDLSGQD